jgi:hypothetical protein
VPWPESEADVLSDAEMREEGTFLRNYADVAPLGRDVHTGGREDSVTEVYLAAIRSIEPGDHP